MSTTQQINVHSDKFTPTSTNANKADGVQFNQSGPGAPSSITVTAPAGTDASTLFGTTTCTVPGTYAVQSTAVVGVTYTLNLPPSPTDIKGTGSIDVTG